MDEAPDLAHPHQLTMLVQRPTNASARPYTAALTPACSVDDGYHDGSAGSNDDSGADDGTSASASNDSAYDDGTSHGNDDSGYDDGSSYPPAAPPASPPVNGAMPAHLDCCPSQYEASVTTHTWQCPQVGIVVSLKLHNQAQLL